MESIKNITAEQIKKHAQKKRNEGEYVLIHDGGSVGLYLHSKIQSKFSSEERIDLLRLTPFCKNDLSGCYPDEILCYFLTATMKEYNFEVYTINPETKENGWDIKFVSVIANTKKEAIGYLKRWPLFDCIITFDYSVEIPYDGCSAKLSKNFQKPVHRGDIVELDGYRGEFYTEILFSV